jgi:hypothetical protein
MNIEPFICDGVLYRTKKAITECCRQIVARYADYIPLSAADAEFIAELLTRHPDYQKKIGCGIAEFFVAPDTRWGTTRHFWLRRIDGTTIDFSWQKCAGSKLSGPKHNGLAAMRHAISDQIQEVREKAFSGHQVLRCPITHQIITPITSHVDHVAPNTFLILAQNWLNERGLTFANIALERSADGYGWVMTPGQQQNDWCAFHRKHAILRVISPLANLSHVKKAI